MSNTPKLNTRQKAIKKSIDAVNTAGAGLVNQVVETITDYWGVDRRSCDNIEFFVNCLHDNNNIYLLSAFRKLLPVFAPVSVKFDKSGKKYTVNNLTKKVSKTVQAKCDKALQDMIKLELTSLLNHPLIKVKVEIEWSDKGAKSKFKKQAREMLEHGIPVNDLLDILTTIAEGSEEPEPASNDGTPAQQAQA